jgi:NAD(P)-dependent dehydrogenase (short-subunit alcohol dehydrogenase family)
MKVALVTAGSGGIGKGIVYKLLDNNYNVAVTGRNYSKLEDVFSNISSNRILFIETDLTSLTSMASAVEQTIEKFGQLNLLVNNAGGATLYQSIECGTEDSFNNAFNLNVKSAFFMSQYAIPYLIETRGSIINFSSVLASRPALGLGPYCASKAAVEMLTQTSALELAPKGVRVMCIAPTATQTEFHVNAGMSEEQADEYYKNCSKTHPLGRVAQVSDITELVLFLADSSKSGFMTGSVVHVDGGRLLTSSSAFKN